jgi:hypothetical protein
LTQNAFVAIKLIHFFQVATSAETFADSRNHYDSLILVYTFDGIGKRTQVCDRHSVNRRVRQNQSYYSLGVKRTLNLQAHDAKPYSPTSGYSSAILLMTPKLLFS